MQWSRGSKQLFTVCSLTVTQGNYNWLTKTVKCLIIYTLTSCISLSNCWKKNHFWQVWRIIKESSHRCLLHRPDSQTHHFIIWCLKRDFYAVDLYQTEGMVEMNNFKILEHTTLYLLTCEFLHLKLLQQNSLLQM